MRILKEAYTEHVKAVVAPDYVTLEPMPMVHGQEPLHLSVTEARELVEWLSHELNRVLPEIILPAFPQKYELKGPGPEQRFADKAKEMASTRTVKTDQPVYEPGPRSATQTVEVKVGDPNLAYKHIGGRTNQSGDGAAETIDLAALAAKVGRP